MRIVDLFSGIGGFHLAAKRVDPTTQCVLACDICPRAREVYFQNFGTEPHSDVRLLRGLPPHDVLCAGFPCQSFSAIGHGEGLNDKQRGMLIWEALRIARASHSPCIMLENVRRLVTLDGGLVLAGILHELKRMGYTPFHRVLNAMDYGLPQRRERVFIIAFADATVASRFEWPSQRPMAALGDILESVADSRYHASTHVKQLTYARRGASSTDLNNRIWITDKGNRVTHRPYALTLRANPSYNNMLVDGVRRFTETEMLRLQGFPDEFKMIGCSYTTTRSLLGNSVPVTMVSALFESIIVAFSDL